MESNQSAIASTVAALVSIVSANIAGENGTHASRYPYICGNDIKGQLRAIGIACRYDDERSPAFEPAFFADSLTDDLASCVEYVRTHPYCEVVLSDSVVRVCRYFSHVDAAIIEATAHVWGSQLGWTNKWRRCPPVSIAQWEAAVIASGVPPFWQA